MWISSNKSEIIERCIVGRVIPLINNYEVLSTNQFGFLQGKKTEYAVLKFIEDVHESLNIYGHSINTLGDFQKAFDTVNHKILLEELSTYCIR